MRKIAISVICLTLALAAVRPLRAYVIATSRAATGEVVRTRWKSTTFPITWRMNPVQGANVTGSRTQAEVFTQAFAAWQSVSTASIAFTQGSAPPATTRQGVDGINVVTTNTLVGDLPTGVLALTGAIYFDGPGVDDLGRTIDFAGQIIEADIYFNATVQFSTDSAAVAGKTDLQAVATHEIGHFLGLDHSALVSATMFWTVGPGFIYPRTLSTDDISAVSILYPSASFATRGKISGTVRTTANAPVYGAVVVAVNASGLPAASAVTDPSGTYTIEGLEAGSYTVYAEPLDGPTVLANISTLPGTYPGTSSNANFTTRYR